MSQTIAVVLPLPVVLALGALILVLLALSAVLVSLRKPALLHTPDWTQGRAPRQREDEEAHAFRLGHLQIDGLAGPAAARRERR